MRICILFLLFIVSFVGHAQQNNQTVPSQPSVNEKRSENAPSKAEAADTVTILEESKITERKKSLKATNMNAGFSADESVSTKEFGASSSQQMKMQTQFISNHTSASTSHVSRSATPIEQQKMNEALGYLQAVVPASYETNLYTYQANHFNTNYFPALEKAANLAPENTTVQKELATYYVLQNEFQKADSIISILGQKNTIVPGQFEYAEDMVNAVQPNGTLVVHGFSDLLPSVYFNSTENTSNNVNILSLDLMQSDTYKANLKAQGYKLPESQLIDTAYLKSFCALNKNKDVYLSLTFPKEYFQGMVSELYPVGLTFHYGKPTFDAVQVNMSLWENNWSNYQFGKKSMDVSDNLVKNYIPTLIQLKTYFEKLNEREKLQKVNTAIQQIGIRTNQSKQLKKYTE